MPSHADFDRVIIEVGAENLLIEGSRQEKANFIAQDLIAEPDLRNWEDEFVGDALVRQASSLPNTHDSEKLVRVLARDGFAISENGEMRRLLPEVADLPQADDDVHRLLSHLGLTTAQGHLDQAIENHGRGQWASANSQLRSFLEELFDRIAERLEPQRAGNLTSAANRRDLLANRQPPFLYEDLGEWGQNGKNFVNGVFKRLHGHGSHPGLSDEEDCTFRLHLVLVVARLFLRRAENSDPSL